MADTEQPQFEAHIATLAEFNANLRLSTQLGRQFTQTMISAFEGIAIRGRGLNDVLKGVALSLSKMVLQAAFRPFERAIGQGLTSLMSGSFGFARGGAFQQGMPVPFARGGVIASPVTFPLTGGGTGLAGEAGAEAIMPLARGPDGRLGVAARGGGATQITVNIATPDVESFRRSEGQVAAALARAVAHGQRNL